MSHEFDVVKAKDVPEEGPHVVFVIRGHVPGAYPNGTFVEKCNSNEGDSYPDGTVGMVISSMEGEDGRVGYQVIFSCDHPLPTIIAEERVRAIPPPTGE